MPHDWRYADLMRQKRLLSIGLLSLGAIVLWTLPFGSRVQQASPPDSLSGTIDGHMVIAKDIELSGDGVFGFTGVPVDDTSVVVVAGVEGRTLIWAETVRVSGPIPQLIEVQNIIQ